MSGKDKNHRAEVHSVWTCIRRRIVDVTRIPGSDLVAHALLDFGTGLLTLSDPMESYGLVAGDPARGTAFSLALYVPNVDEVTATAEARGATIRPPGSRPPYWSPSSLRPGG